MTANSISTTLAIIGGGPAGYVAAIRASQLGASVVVVERDKIGGVCLNRGCIPTKTLLKTSEVAYSIKKSKEFGIDSSISKINWNISNDRKNRVVKNLLMGLEHLLPSKNIRVLKGNAQIISSKQIIVPTIDGEVTVNCKKLMITTGSSPLLPNIKGINLNGVITSNEALQLLEIPKSIVVIGAGAIGVEFAAMFNWLGVKVTVIEMKDRILPYEDAEITTELLKIMKRQGVSFKLSAIVKEISEGSEGLEVIIDDNGKAASIAGQNVLVAIGRRLNADSPEIKNLGLETKNGAIVVNEKFETNMKDVYAAGDVIGGRLLAHLAFAEGKAASENALGMDSRINYDAIPSCIYTIPEVASVGINEEEALRLGIEIAAGRFYFRNNGRALSLGERDGFVKIIIDKNTNEIIGGQILGANASEIISEITLAITLRAKADVIADMVHPHPALSEAVWEACSDAIGRSIHSI